MKNKIIIAVIVAVYFIGYIVVASLGGGKSAQISFVLYYPLILLILGIISGIAYMYSKDKPMKEFMQIFLLSFLGIFLVGFSFCGAIAVLSSF